MVGERKGARKNDRPRRCEGAVDGGMGMRPAQDFSHASKAHEQGAHFRPAPQALETGVPLGEGSIPLPQFSHVDVEGLANLMALIQAVVGQQGLQARLAQPPQNCQRSIYEDIIRAKKLGIEDYSGDIDGSKAGLWIRHVERTFNMMELDDGRKVTCIRYLLGNRGADWWEQKLREMGDVVPTWEVFKKEFFDFFYPPTYNGLQLQKFFALEQGERTVAEYVTKYEKLIRFAPGTASHDGEKCAFFVRGLTPYIRQKIREGDYGTYATARAAAFRIEFAAQSEGKFDGAKKRKTATGTQHVRISEISGHQKGGFRGQGVDARTGSGTGNWFRFAHSRGRQFAPASSTGYVARGIGVATAINWQQKTKHGNSFVGPFTCFQCGEIGHKRANCPKLEIVQVRPVEHGRGQDQGVQQGRGANVAAMFRGQETTGVGTSSGIRMAPTQVYAIVRPEKGHNNENMSGEEALEDYFQ